MGFIDRYVSALTSANLQDDAHHHTTDALCAAALADTTGAGLGALLSRVKYSDGSVSKTFESGTANLAQLLRIWKLAVRQKGTERHWVKMTAAWDIAAAHALFERVAERSLAHWLDGKCKDCGGTGQQARRLCTCCGGTGQATLEGGGYEREKVLDMVSELEGLLQAHNTRASRLLANGRM